MEYFFVFQTGYLTDHFRSPLSNHSHSHQMNPLWPQSQFQLTPSRSGPSHLFPIPDHSSSLINNSSGLQQNQEFVIEPSLGNSTPVQERYFSHGNVVQDPGQFSYNIESSVNYPPYVSFANLSTSSMPAPMEIQGSSPGLWRIDMQTRPSG